MNISFLENNRVYWMLLGIGCVFLIAYPSTLLVSDEFTYLSLSQQLRLKLGWLSEIPPYFISHYQDYVLGYPLLLALFSTLFGVKSAFVINAVFCLVSILLCSALLKRLSLNPLWAFGILCFVPVLIFGRLLMSEASGLVIVSIFLALLFSKNQSSGNYFWLGLITSLSFFFRESLVVLLFPILVCYVLRYKREGILTSILGLMIGVLPFIIFNYMFYGSISLRDPGVGFGFSLVIQNLLIILLVFTLLLPGALWVIFRASFRLKNILLVGMVFFILLHLFYGYNGIFESGPKGIMLYSRYFIPLLPIVVICYADYFGNNLVRIIAWIGISSYSITSFGFMYLEQQYRTVYKMISKHVPKNSIINTSYQLNEVSKIINPVIGYLTLGNIDILSWSEVPKGQYYLQINRTDTNIWKEKVVRIPGHQLVIDSAYFLNHVEYKLYQK